MIKEEYSPYKIVHHLDKITELKEGKQTVPLQVQIVPSNACNQRCVFCAYRMSDGLSNETFNERDFLSYDKIIETLDCFVTMGVKAVQYTGGGEPLVHKDIFKTMEQTLERNLDLSLVTNGQALTPEMCELLGRSLWVRVSVDSGREETYSFIRNVPKVTFTKVMKNIECLVKNKKENIIGIGFVVEKENYREILYAAKLFKYLGVDNMRISAAFTPMGYKYFESFEKQATELAKEAESLSDNTFKVFNLFNDRVKDTFIGKQNYEFCPIKELQVYIGADYGVYTCCTLAYNHRGYIGSIKDKTFEELWNGESKIEKYKNHNPVVHCKFSCMYKGKNDFINYCIKKEPKHINFI